MSKDNLRRDLASYSGVRLIERFTLLSFIASSRLGLALKQKALEMERSRQ